MVQREQLIDNGRVGCAIQRRDVDIDECLCCERLIDIRIDPRFPAVVCRIDPARERPAELA
jgi:hypothetical protein